MNDTRTLDRPLQRHFARKSVSLVALAVAVGFIEVAATVACPAVAAEALASPLMQEESVRPNGRNRSGLHLLGRVSHKPSGSPEAAAAGDGPSYQLALAARRDGWTAANRQVDFPDASVLPPPLVISRPVTGRAPPRAPTAIRA